MKIEKKEKPKESIHIKIIFFLFMGSCIYPILMIILTNDVRVFIPKNYIIILVTLYVGTWIGYFVLLIGNYRKHLFLISIMILAVATIQVLFGYLGVVHTISFITIQNNLGESKERLKVIEAIDYESKEGVGEYLVVEYLGNESETPVLLDIFSKVKESKCKFIEVTVYKGNLGLFYLKDTRKEHKVCVP